jgi:ion channel-forming bestrophin family protein
MIVRDTPRAWEVFFVVRGSIAHRILPQIICVAGISLVIVLSQRFELSHLAPVEPLALSVIGGALAIFSSFRNAASYDRWWEARKVIGQIIIEARNLSREAQAYIAGDKGDDLGRQIAGRCIAFMFCVRDHLRDRPISDDTAMYLQPEEEEALQSSLCPPNCLLGFFSRDIARAAAEGRLDQQMTQLLENRVVGLTSGFASAERTKGTPMPFVYTLLVHRTAYFFCLLLPFCLVDASGYWTPVLAAVVAYTFFALDEIGQEMASPYCGAEHGLPLDALSRVVEINILESLGETELPAPLRPVNFVLT